MTDYAGRLRLGVNIDHVATVRNARGGSVPDPLRAALAGATALIGPRTDTKTEHLSIPTPMGPIVPGLDATVVLTESLPPDVGVPLENGGQFLHWREVMEGEARQIALYDRDKMLPGQAIDGPAIIKEPTGTNIIEPGWQGQIDGSGNLILERYQAINRILRMEQAYTMNRRQRVRHHQDSSPQSHQQTVRSHCGSRLYLLDL